MRINALSLAVILATLAAAGPGLAAEKGPLSQVWGRIKVDVGMMKLPFGVPNDLAISLEAADGKGYKRQVVSDSNEMRNAVKSGKFVFRAVPTETPLKLTVSYTSPAGTTDTYSSTYVFHQPDLNVIQKLREDKALEMAGYLGDFTIRIEPAKIVHNDRYE